MRRVGVLDDSVIVGPRVGEDAAIIKLGESLYLVAHLDPITAAGRLAGWLAVHVACNDVAASGARPRWLLSLILAPSSDPSGFIDGVTRQMHEAAVELRVGIVGGHTEVVEGREPLVAVTAMGVTSRPVPTSGARPGDYIVMTKTAGIEGTAILATDYEDVLRDKLGVDVVERAKRMIRMVSVVREALTLSEAGLADAMHDPTEGGVIGGVYEMAYASRLAAELWLDEIPVAEETRLVAEAMGVDPYRLISSGVLLAAIPPEKLREALDALDRIGVEARVIGRFLDTREPIVYVKKSGEIVEIVKEMVPDEIYRVASSLRSRE